RRWPERPSRCRRCAGGRGRRWRPSTGRGWSSASSSSCWLTRVDGSARRRPSRGWGPAGRGALLKRRTNVPNTVLWIVLGLSLAAAAALAGRKLVTWALTLRARSLTPTLLRILSRWVRTHSYSDVEFFRADGAGDSLAERRRAGIERLAAHFSTRYPESTAWGGRLRESFSDLRLTDANPRPVPFARS